jgi:hypothetical protein
MPLIDKSRDSQVHDIQLKAIDRSVVNWWEKDFPVIINGKNVPVIYATAERWAKAQIDKGFRDESGILILPIISIRRTTPDHHKERYVPANTDTNITLTRRVATTPLSETERQSSVYSRVADPDYIKSADDVVYEIVQIEFPSFVNLDYEITVWTSYMSHQNLNQENIYKEFRGGRQWFHVDDYFFFGKMGTAQDQSNLDEFSDKEKIIKYKFNLALQAYFVDKSKVKIFRTAGNTKINISFSELKPKKIKPSPFLNVPDLLDFGEVDII